MQSKTRTEWKGLVIVALISATAAACGGPSPEKNEAESPTQLAEKIQAGDTSICASPAVLKMVTRNLAIRLQHGEQLLVWADTTPEFNSIAATDVKRQPPAVMCSGNIVLGGRPYGIEYALRPSLQEQRGVVTEVTAPDEVADALGEELMGVIGNLSEASANTN